MDEMIITGVTINHNSKMIPTLIEKEKYIMDNKTLTITIRTASKGGYVIFNSLNDMVFACHSFEELVEFLQEHYSK